MNPKRLGAVTCLSALLAVACGGEGSSSTTPAPSAEARCQEIIQRMAQCYPDLAQEATCNETTIGQFEGYNLAQESCQAIGDLGKADVFAAGGCGNDEHVCSWLFCCKNYHLTWFPSAADDWDIVGVVDKLHDGLPGDIKDRFASASREELLAGMSDHYSQGINEFLYASPEDMAVEYTRQLVEVPYDKFTKALPVQDWGVKLAHYLGGEVKVYETDGSGRATRQLERMVLSSFPCDVETALLNNDMTKVEVIKYEATHARVNWRVMYSNNNSTVTDVGSVEFEAYDSKSTLITFHSAHQLNAPGGIPLPLSVIELALSPTFLDHTHRYASIAKSGK